MNKISRNILLLKVFMSVLNLGIVAIFEFFDNNDNAKSLKFIFWSKLKTMK